MNFTPIVKPYFAPRIRVSRQWADHTETVQRHQLRMLLRNGRATEFGHKYGFDSISTYEEWADKMPLMPYNELRPWIMRMVTGERDVLWPGVTRRFAQSSGTSDGRSKYIPITQASLHRCHYQGGADVVAHYLHLYPDSRLFSGKSFILGGSFANEIAPAPGVRVGDLSANLIEAINPLANMVRIPDKATALMMDWAEKLPALIRASIGQNVTNISGVPSWFLTVIKGVLEQTGASTIHEVWPNLEVFFHGGISFEPYREQYRTITDPTKMRYLETYNASEGFFAVQDRIDSHAMLMLLDLGIFYEFMPIDQIDAPNPLLVPSWKVKPGETYAMVITANNGLWRYPLGDTVRIETVNPLRITIAGRTKNYINAFGEELMVHNADAALSATCAALDCAVRDYTAAPIYAGNHTRGRHQWLIEFERAPESLEQFAQMLDDNLRKVNSDYDAKRSHGLFLDRLSISVAQPGLFARWLASTGKLGGQRKGPRLSNDRTTIDALLSLLSLLTE
ncbi:MAG: GH3 auxin-responsive promoter family protein [Muribaculaceae bacterium]|nr:GH3 auxin-responsive promoter family protein [Muribaculaceae bacterium]